MEVKFKIVTLGYIVAEILSETKRFKIGHSSDYGDIFQELLNKLFFIYEIIKEKDIAYFPYSTTLFLGGRKATYHYWFSCSNENETTRGNFITINKTIRRKEVEINNSSPNTLLLKCSVEVRSLKISFLLMINIYQDK
jgi:hypothetical protein